MINREAVLLLRSDRLSMLGLVLLLVCGLWLLLQQRITFAEELSVDALIALCERADAQAGIGVDAAFCDWYLLPCDCKLGQPGQAPRWCLPDPATEPRAFDEARKRILAALERSKRAGQAAEEAVAQILARLYPCAPD